MFNSTTVDTSRFGDYFGGATDYFKNFKAESFLQDHPVVKLAYIILITGFTFSYAKSIYDAKTSKLEQIPGPWYAPFTTMHLQWMFARGTIWKFVRAKHFELGPVIRLGPRQIWVCDKAALKDILATTDLPKVSMYAEISRDRQSPGLFGEIRPRPHGKLKRFLGPAFTISSVDELDHFFMGCVSGLLKNYYRELRGSDGNEPKENFITDLMRDLHCLALDIMGESAFGKGFGQIDQIFNPSLIKTKADKDWAKIPDAIFDGQAKRYQMVFVKRMLRKLGLFLNFDWPSDMTKAISSLVDKRRAIENGDEESTEEKRRDVLQHMLEEGNRPDNGVKMTNQDIIDQMSELLLAGSETTSGTIACLFLELARNPEVRKKLLDSLPVLGENDDVLDSKTVREDPQYRYLEACIKENLRKHPIASEMGRRTLDQPWKCGDYEIPPFTVVSASYRQCHLNEEHWPQPEKFWPERWLEGDEREGAPEPDMDAYFPFSAGKHSCIGQNFAYAEIRTLTANIFTRFDVAEVDHKVIDFRQFITMQFHDGSWRTKLTPRTKAEAAK